MGENVGFFFFLQSVSLWHCKEFKENDLNLNSIHALAFRRVELPTESHSGTMQAVGMFENKKVIYFLISLWSFIFPSGWEMGSSPSILISLYFLLLFGHLGIL